MYTSKGIERKGEKSDFCGIVIAGLFWLVNFEVLR
jgi:hypothetical protein